MNVNAVRQHPISRSAGRWAGRIAGGAIAAVQGPARPAGAMASGCEFDYDYYVCLAVRRREGTRR